VGEQRVVGGAQRGRPVADAGSLRPERVPEERADPGLVVGDPVADETVEPVEDEPGVLGETLDDVARRPAALVLQGLRQIPVV
jgi:hypothetical protein